MAVDGTTHRCASLRGLMILIVLLAVVPIFALHVVRLHASAEVAVDHARAHAMALAEAGVGAHERIADQARNLLEVVAQIPAVRSATLPDCDHVLKSIQAKREWLTGIFVVGPDGRGVCGGNPTVRTLDVSDRDYFRNAVASGKFNVSDVIVSRVTGTHIVAAVLPLYDELGNLHAVLGVGVRLSWINQVTAEATKKFGGMLIALDGAGQVIAYQPGTPADWAPGTERSRELAKTIVNASNSTIEAEDNDGIMRIFSVARMPDSSITVAVGLRRDDVLGIIEQNFVTDLLFLLLVAVASIGASFLVAEFGLLRGVRALKTAARRLKAGKMGLRVSLPAFVAAELHDLAATYNAMTAEFERLAYLDRLTGLPNRRYMERHMAQRNERGGARGCEAVLAIDIDGFKPVNDCHGHAVGDRVLAIIARRIAGAIDERGLLFRVGGDEFVAIVPLGTDGRESARSVGEDIRFAMEQAIEVDGRSFTVACSIGIALVPDDANTLAGALVVADGALYEAKRTGRNRVVDLAPSVVPVARAMQRRASGRPRAQLGATW
jgi:diguanylate cyclase (GGDEF)-like protein